MDRTVAVCGLVCSQCPALLATVNDDDDKRKETADAWSKQFGMELTAEEINCRGCQSGGDEVIGYCRVCEIRQCGQDKGLENCAHCGEYSCDKLNDFFKRAPHAKPVLDEIRVGLKLA